MAGIVVSTIAFFMVRYYVNRCLDDIGIEKSLTRGIVAFCAALLIACLVAYAVDRLAG